MAYTLMSLGRVLGRTGVELPPPAPAMRSWHFVPAAAFAKTRALFAALPAAIEDSQEAIPTQGELEEIPEAEREAWMRELLRADARMARFIELSEELDALALVLLDEHGTRVDASTIGVTELEIATDVFRQVLVTVDSAADLSNAKSPPFYLLVANTG